LDLAYDHTNNFAYIVVQSIISNHQDSTKTYTIEEIYKYDITNQLSTKLNIPVDDSGSMRQKSVAVDPNATSVVYVGGAGQYFSSDTALLRSIDGGENWSVLTTSNNSKYPSKATNQGGYEVSTIRVNPYDGKVWIACGCYGYETFNPPYDSSLLNNTKPSSHTITYIYGDKQVNQVTVKNNGKHNFVYDEDGLTFVSWYKDRELTQEFANGSNVYQSMKLYAKMENSIRIQFYDRNQLLYEKDLDSYDASQIPTREGYVFAEWYIDDALNTVADFSQITSNTSVYAGWYKLISNVDIEQNDIEGYIKYSDQTLQKSGVVDDTANVDNRCVHLTVDKNATYFIRFKMDTRFRIGVKNNTNSGSLSQVYIHPLDNNGSVSVNEYLSTTIQTGDNTHLFIYYYTSSGSQSFIDIKNTINVYKIENTDVQANNLF
ncbi:MAG: InlB B-repeat-containing protein, partial [Clostridia bacterium]|nr:InlB B-repeat-containing protein [Clostridia bacterium]